ncbi:MAG: MBL fold metallo-hydrolase [Paludibacterium sp.]|uniref:MBL fold metallo-hydrolase n=1 Tax=Paludibacterium sp. TaxID=1917523 RepID=UPI0025F8B303|nr:MBL fold metallo-hydrolase [Paludibacterium sp.]MBV8045982.1 MBL fold metallo-hydrolase [Paludibacterium sp.]MBV8648903.1 MBL fold metallo-hydrolase [Paludibacterium sp.]
MIVSVLGTAAGTDTLAATSSYLVDNNTLLDCGTGVETLPTESLLAIERVLLTHAHVDHVGGLAALLACHAQHGGQGVTVHTQQETVDELTSGLLADVPLTGYLTTPGAGGLPLLRFQSLEVGDTIPLPDGMATALPAQHRSPAIGWVIEGPWRALAYTGDSGPCPAFWHWAANVPSLSDIICELTYASSDAERAKAEGHMTPGVLLGLLEVIPPNVQIWISHLSSAQREQALSEIKRIAPANLNIAELKPGTVIDL